MPHLLLRCCSNTREGAAPPSRWNTGRRGRAWRRGGHPVDGEPRRPIRRRPAVCFEWEGGGRRVDERVDVRVERCDSIWIVQMECEGGGW